MFHLIKKYKASIISMTIAMVVLIVYMITYQVEPFGKNTFVIFDCYQALSPLLAVLRDKLVNGEGLLYFWNGYLGGDFLSVYYYHLASPINFFVVFFSEEKINLFITCSIVIRIVLSAGIFSYSISKIGKNDNVYINIALSLAYAFSGYICGYKYNIMWLDSYMIFPLIMLGYIRLVDRKPALYVISLTFSAICNFFMTYIIGVFLVIWFLLDEHNDFAKFIKNGIYFGLMSLLSIGLSFVNIIIPFLASRDSYATSSAFPKHVWLGNIFEVLRYQFVLSKPIGLSYTLNNANLYCGMFVIPITIAYLFGCNISIISRLKRILLIVFLYASMNEYLMIYLWHGMHIPNGIPNRFSFCLIYVLLLTSYQVLDGGVKNKKAIVLGIIFSEIISVMCFCESGFDSVLSMQVVLGVSLVLILLYGIIVLYKSINVVKRFTDKIFMGMVIVELSVNLFFSFGFYQASDEIKTNIFLNDLIEETNYHETDLFYRSEIVGGDLINNNLDMYYNIKGRSGFNSFIPVELSDFLSKVGGTNSEMCILPLEYPGMIDNLLGIKYLYTNTGIIKDNLPKNYEIFNESEQGIVLKNSNEISLGYGVNEEIENTVIEGGNIIDNLNILSKGIFSQKYAKDVFEINSPSYDIQSDAEYSVVEDRGINILYNNVIGEEYLVSSFKFAETGQYYLDFGNLSDVEIQIYNNDKNIYNGTISGERTIYLGEIDDNDVINLVIFGSEEKKENEYNICFAKICDEYSEIEKELLQNRLEITDFSCNKIRGNINMQEGQVLFLSVPYNEGWHIYDNGTEIEKQKLLNCFIGIPLGSGYHEIEMVYVPQGLYVGIVISLLSWCIFVGYMIYSKKN